MEQMIQRFLVFGYFYINFNCEQNIMRQRIDILKMIPPLLPMLRATLKNCESGWGHLNSIGKEVKGLFFKI